MPTRALREYATRRGWKITLQVKEIGPGTAERQTTGPTPIQTLAAVLPAAGYRRAAANSAWNGFAFSGWCKAAYSAARSSQAYRRNFMEGLVCFAKIL